MNQIFYKICLLTCLLGLAWQLPAQTEAEAATLVIESQQGGQQQTLKIGDRLNYKVKDGRMQRKGRIEAVTDTSVTIAAKTLAFQDLDVVVQLKGKRQPVGGGLLVGSLIAEPITLLLWIVSLLFLLDNPSQGQRVLIGVLGVLVLIIFPLLLVLGIVLLAIGSKTYDLRSKWKLRKGEAPTAVPE
jgi:hypothetical protein